MEQGTLWLVLSQGHKQPLFGLASPVEVATSVLLLLVPFSWHALLHAAASYETWPGQG